ncbi:MAG TPA: BBP7 family outer membrane beta-barrel protein [Pirellulales bacterium]|nr:BBP7 family outer membrane beta-barrel protein [Pirellulales bacterium]
MALFSTANWVARLAVMALALSTALAAHAAEPFEATIDADSVHVRSGPGTEYYATDILRRGDRVEVLGYDAGGWCRIRPPRGSFSLVSVDSVQIGPNGTARIKDERAEIGVGSRFYARRDAVQIILERGDTVELAEEQPRSETGGKPEWYKITPPDGEYRWIHEQYLHAEERAPRRHVADRLEDESLDDGAIDDAPRVQRASYEEPAGAPRLLGDVSSTPLVPVPEERSITAVLDELELGVAAIARGENRNANLALMETDARNVARRAQTASDRNRADIVLRRLDRLAGKPRQTSGASTIPDFVLPGLGEISLTQFMSPMMGAPTTCPVPGGPGYLAAPMSAPIVAAPPAAPLYAPYAPPGPRHYLNLDFLGFWAKHDSLPALVTTSPIGTPQAEAGVLGQPGTSVLFGNQNVLGGFRPGGRVMGGIWLDNEQTFALEGNYWTLATASVNYSAASVFTGGSTGQILARPFFDSNPLVNAQSALLVAYPNAVIAGVPFNINGSVSVNETSNIQSAGAGGRWGLGQYTSPGRFFIVGGYRFFQLNESLSIISRSSEGPPPFPARPNITVFDYFSTSNNFNGGDIGLAGEYRSPRRFWFGGEGRLAMGNMQETLKIDGVTTAAASGFTATLPNGLLAQPSNIGSFTQNHFALIPSVDLKVGYHLTPGFRLTVGYNFTYITRVIRPGAQVDTTVNTSQIAGLPLVGPANPSVLFNQGSLWLQGVTAGFDLAF